MLRKTSCLLSVLFVLLFTFAVGGVSANAMTDIPEKYSKEINYLINKEVIFGYPDGLFHPDRAVTRAEAAAMIGRAIDLNGEKRDTAFTDVDSTLYASGYIQSAYEKGIISGYGDNTYRPKRHITRGEMAILISKAFNLSETSEVYYYDVTGSGYQAEAINMVSTAGIAAGYPDGSYKPDKSITRAEFSLLVARGLNPEFKVESEFSPIGTKYVSATILNVREGPSTSYDVIAQLSSGDKVTIYKETGNWAYITFGSLKGYVHTDYLRDDLRRIAIDAGHGGDDPGASGNGIIEKELNLDVALRVEKYLKNAGIQVVMTRKDDTFISLDGRVEYAVTNGADAFVSIHANAFTPNAQGTETYYSTAALSERAEASKQLATYIQNRLVAALDTYDRGVKENTFRVIYKTPLPSTLLELGFITNTSDAQKLSTSYYRDKAAKAIYLGIEDYYNWKERQ